MAHRGAIGRLPPKQRAPSARGDSPLDPGVLIGAGTLVLMGLSYFAGVQRGARQERDRRQHDREQEEDRRIHELSRNLVARYVDMSDRRFDSGPHALARLGLHLLGSDLRIREAIRAMHAQTGADPWQGNAQSVDGIDLVAFFHIVEDERIDFFRTTVETVAARLRG